MGIMESFKDVRYRIRIFDHDNFLMSAEAPDKGQRYITATVHKSGFAGLGEKTKLAFMINPAIKPKIFNGKIMEIDFDIRDSVQLGDLIDVVPDLVYEINKNYKMDQGKKNENGKTIDADFTIKKNPGEQDLPPIPKDPLTEEEEEDYRALDDLLKRVNDLKAISPFLPVVRSLTSEEKKQANVIKCLELAEQHPKLLYWLPKYLKIEPEIHQLVSQSLIYRVGVQPSYYTAQSGAMIAEKMLARPKESTGWQQVVIYGLIIIGVLGSLGLVIWLLKG